MIRNDVNMLEENLLATTYPHRIHYSVFGNPDGIPLLFIHGGPGAYARPEHAQFLCPQHFRIIQFDQRGCGRSLPSGSLLYNSTFHLLTDMEALRKHLGIERWVVYGGSWGATLALEYSKRYTTQVLALLLRGSFLGRKTDWDWFSQPDGVAQSIPEAYRQLRAALRCEPDDDIADALHRRLFEADASTETLYRYALAWDAWESAVMGLPAPGFNPDASVWQSRINSIRIYAYYGLHRWFLPPEGVLPGLERIRHIPGAIVHGLQDRVCQHAGAALLAEKLPRMRLKSIEAGHGMHESVMQQTVQQAANSLFAYLSSSKVL
ncbi:alpha/beta fold hydrolase [Thiothrix nivea]|nr:alpha/beta fold hydrolase [Thiothrix nivea]